MKEIEQRIRQDGIVAIVRGDFGQEQLLAYAKAMLDNGLTVMEVTMNSAGALEAIEALRKRYGAEMVIGAGTVRNTAHFLDAVAAGAQFTVAPATEVGTIEASFSENILHLPGIFTASEAETAFGLGCKMLKLFPANQLGPNYLKALRAPLDNISFVPTGGITPENIGVYRQAGAAAVGVGSSLIKAGVSVEEVGRRARGLRTGWNEA